MNKCGNCKLCCKLMGIAEIDKPPGKWCEWCDQTGPRGCKIHTSKPSDCMEFECGYLLSDLPLKYRPDKSHFIITGEDRTLGCLFAIVDPEYPETFYSKNLENLLAAALKSSNEVLNAALITMGEDFRVLALDEKAARKLIALVRAQKRK